MFGPQSMRRTQVSLCQHIFSNTNGLQFISILPRNSRIIDMFVKYVGTGVRRDYNVTGKVKFLEGKEVHDIEDIYLNKMHKVDIYVRDGGVIVLNVNLRPEEKSNTQAFIFYQTETS